MSKVNRPGVVCSNSRAEQPTEFWGHRAGAQGIRWREHMPPPHGDAHNLYLISKLYLGISDYLFSFI